MDLRGSLMTFFLVGVKHVVLHIVSDVGSKDLENVLYLEGQLDFCLAGGFWNQIYVTTFFSSVSFVYRIFDKSVFHCFSLGSHGGHHENPQELTWKMKIDWLEMFCFLSFRNPSGFNF